MIVWWATLLFILLICGKIDGKINSSVPFHMAQIEELFRVLYGSKPLFLVRRSSNQEEDTEYS